MTRAMTRKYSQVTTNVCVYVETVKGGRHKHVTHKTNTRQHQHTAHAAMTPVCYNMNTIGNSNRTSQDFSRSDGFGYRNYGFYCADNSLDYNSGQNYNF